MLRFRWVLALTGLAGLVVSGCASDKGIILHSLNNVAARDNAFFIARTKLYETETKLYAGRTNDYNQVLPLFPTLDSASVKANRADLNDIIKKASMPIQHRPGSDWTDNAYLLVAWSRFYQMQFDDALLTFKYVNTTSRDPNSRHEALIGMMRVFVNQNQFESAKAVSDILDKETGIVKNARELFLTRADYYLKTEQPDKAIPQLERAIPLIQLKNERSRTRFILSQLYQDAEQNKKAEQQLKLILARNPPYELDFQAKLMMAQVSDLGVQDRALLDKYFAALLKDPNNKEYRDKIYYEMGRYAYRQKNYPEALKLLKKSAKISTTNKSQKSYSYLLAGRIYYENLKKYRLAAAYYDSTVQNMPQTAKNYAAIKERSLILKDFAAQYTIIETQDSLQTLAKLSPDSLDQRLGRYAAAELAAKAKADAAKAKAAKAAASAAEFAARQAAGGNSRPNMPGQTTTPDPLAFDPTAVGAGAQWYFDNPVTLGTAHSDFVRKYGNRQLVDNWRTSSQITTTANTPPNGTTPQSGPGGSDPSSLAANKADKAKADSVAKAKAIDPEVAKKALVDTYRKGLPLTPELLEASDVKIEAAYYSLGSIFKEQLKERDSGIATYEKQVGRYPRGKHAPEAYYLLYIHYRELPDAAKAAQYAAALQREFPNSTYAKLIADPLYREHELALHKAVAARLDEAFTLYKDQEFTKAAGVVAALEQAYPKNDLTDRIAYLKTLLVIRTQPPLSARASVEQFYKDYPTSPLAPTSQALAATYAKIEKGQITGAIAPTDKPSISMFRPGEVDNRMRIFYTDDDHPSITPAPTPTAPTPDVKDASPAAPAPTLGVPAPSGSAGPAPSGSAGPAPSSIAPVQGLQPSADPISPVPAPASASPTTAPTNSSAPPPVVAPGTKNAPPPINNVPPGAGNTTSPGNTAPTNAAPGNSNAAPASGAATGARPAGGTAPATGNATPGNPTTGTTTAGSTTTAARGANPAPAAPAGPYTTQLSAAHAVVLVFPKTAPAAADLPTQLGTYNNRFFRANNLQIQPQALGTTQDMLVIRPLVGAKVAQSYATKLRGPQSPLARLRGSGYQAIIISLDNLAQLQASGDLAGYQSFYQRVYK